MFERENRTRRLFDVDDSPGVDAVFVGFESLLGVALEGEHKTAVVILPTLGHTRRLGDSIGPAHASDLRKRGRMTARGIDIMRGTHRDLHVTGTEPVLVMWANDDVLVKVDDRQPPVIIAVASATERIGEWLANWGPGPLRAETTPAAPPEDEVGADAAAALKGLTAAVNCGSGLLDPRDKQAAVRTYRDLAARGVPCAPRAARIWAVNNGWTAEGARQLETVGREVHVGMQHRFR